MQRHRPPGGRFRRLGRLGRPFRRPGRSGVPSGIRITKVGLWYVLFAVLVAISATNTGNNALYLVVSLMLGALVVSGLVSRANVRRLSPSIALPREVYANQPFAVEMTVANRGLTPRFLLLGSVARNGPSCLFPRVPRRATASARLEMLLDRRGHRAIPPIELTSLFPFGFFRKGTRYPSNAEVLVYPELYPGAAIELETTGELGEVAARRAGWGHDLHTLRGFRDGDDPRGIHWKRTARTGKLVYMEREAEESRRLSILFDNSTRAAGGELDEADRARFERLVSEAATTAVEYLDNGFEIELVTRGRSLGFGGGPRQRRAALELLALVEPVKAAAEGRRAGADALVSRASGVPQVRFALERPLSRTTAAAAAGAGAP